MREIRSLYLLLLTTEVSYYQQTMTNTEAVKVLNSKRHIDAVLFYRRNPIETNDSTFRLADAWIQASLKVERM